MQALNKVVLIDGKISSDELKLLVLPCPKDLLPVIYLQQNNVIYEIQHISPRQEFGCWFLNQRVSSDASYLIATRIDLKFLCLPSFRACRGNYSPLDQILTKLQSFDTISLNCFNKCNFEVICDINNDLGDDMILYRYNESKTMNWLKHKVDSASKTFSKQRKKKQTNSNSIYANSFNVSNQSEKKIDDVSLTSHVEEVNNDDIINAFQIVCDYLEEELSSKLLTLFNFDKSILQGKASNINKRKADWESELEVCCYMKHCFRLTIH